MIRLGGLVSQKAFGKFEMGKVISNPFAKAFVNEAEGEDHEVSMGQNQLDTIIKMATELKAKMGENEKEIPAWIQDHISKAENYISQAAGNYHEYGQNEGTINEDSETKRLEMLIKNLEETNKLLVQQLKDNKSLSNNKKENIKKSIALNLDLINYYKKWLKDYQSAANESINEAGRVPKMYVKYMAVQKKVNELEAKQKEMAAKYFAEKELNKKSKIFFDKSLVFPSFFRIFEYD